MNKSIFFLIVFFLFATVAFAQDYSQATSEQQTDNCYAKSLRIAVIDGFTNKRIDFDNDGIGDLSHGDMIVRFLEEGLPNAEIVKFDLENPDIPLEVWRIGPGYILKILLNRIINEIENGNNYDAINISISHSKVYKNESEKKSRIRIFRKRKKTIEPTFLILTPDNLLSRRNLIKSELDYLTMSCITLIEKLNRIGCRVYIAAGNQGKEAFNLLNLATGAINVGALNEDGTISEISSNNVLINRWARSVFPVCKTENGIDFTGDGTTDIFYHDLSAAGENLINNLIGGTSVAVPIAIVEDLSEIKK